MGEEQKKKQIKISLKGLISIILIIIAIIVVVICSNLNKKMNTQIANNDNPGNYQEVDWPDSGIDDWQEMTENSVIDSLSTKSMFEYASDTTGTSSISMSETENIGLSTGGAKDVNNFRENIEEGYFPITTDITYNGLFYDYYFDTSNEKTEVSDELFYPTYSIAVSNDPISQEEEYYMTVGLNSNIKESDFARKKLNIAVVLDISGSMSSSFSSYYYDGILKENDEELNKSKMQIANESVNILIDQLNSDDRFGMVLFESDAYIVKPMNLVKDTNMKAIKNHILEIQSQGGTNFEAGYIAANELFKDYQNIDKNEYENRIIVITDAMPNSGDTSEDGLLSMVKKNAENGIYTTFIGVGVDFNTELIEEITDAKGANYYSVHSSDEFKERMGEQFEYMVTPLVFDLNLSLESSDYKIESVYGSDTDDFSSGNIMKVNTLFPSKTSSEGEVKGGVVLLKLKKISDNDGKLKLNVSYKDRNENPYSNSQEVDFYADEEYYDNTGIRKAILLTRYANILKNWILYERSEDEKFIIISDSGIKDCVYTEDEIYALLGEHERTSQKLSVSNDYKKIFEEFKVYMKSEIKEINDDTLNQEIDVLNTLIARAGLLPW